MGCSVPRGRDNALAIGSHVILTTFRALVDNDPGLCNAAGDGWPPSFLLVA